MARGFIRLRVKDIFFDSKKVQAALSRAERSVLSRFGSFVRRTDKNSMRPARPIPISQLPPEQRKAYEPKRDKAGRFLPLNQQPKNVRLRKRPLAASKPGEPPRVRLGLVKDFTFFGFDTRKRSVVVGPMKLSGFRDQNVVKNLEEGGQGRSGRIAARPHTLPAMRKELPKLAPMWRNSIRG